jgi:hypothetical protein
MTSIKSSVSGFNKNSVSPSVKRGVPARVPSSAPLEDMTPDMLRPPARRGFQSIPTPEVLEKLVARALAALKKGMFWDRGSILNIVV